VVAQRKQLGGGAFADGETDAKKAIVDGPFKREGSKCCLGQSAAEQASTG
jgi:hypothetical protein